MPKIQKVDKKNKSRVKCFTYSLINKKPAESIQSLPLAGKISGETNAVALETRFDGSVEYARMWGDLQWRSGLFATMKYSPKMKQRMQTAIASPSRVLWNVGMTIESTTAFWPLDDNTKPNYHASITSWIEIRNIPRWLYPAYYSALNPCD